MQIEKHKVVTIDYTLKDEQGAVVDTSRGDEPLAYIHGIGALVKGLESALEGRTPGEAFEVGLTAEQGYGPRDDSLEHVVSREIFKGHTVEVGMQFRAKLDGDEHVFTVTEVKDEDVTVDGNHPLAGKALHFNVKVVDVRDATAEELEHGHAHGPQGH